MSGVIYRNKQQWERCCHCGRWTKFQDLLFGPSVAWPEFKNVDLGPECVGAKFTLVWLTHAAWCAEKRQKEHEAEMSAKWDEDLRRGYDAYLAGEPKDPGKSEAWIEGWGMAQDDAIQNMEA